MSAMRQRDDLVRLGALDVTSSRDDLLAMVLDVLGRGPESTGDLQR